MNKKSKLYFGKIPTIIIVTILGIYAITIIYPFLWILLNSFKTVQEFFSDPYGLPTSFNFASYIKAWEEANIGRYFFNSILYMVIITFITLLLQGLTGYTLAKYEFKGRSLIYTLGIVGMLIPQIGTLSPWYRFMGQMGLFNPQGWIISSAVGLGGQMLILYAYFRGIPWEFAEAGFVEGAGHFRVFFNIMVPLAKPGLAVVMMLKMIGVWNDYFYPSILIQNEKWYPLAVGLQKMMLTQQYAADWTTMFAGIIIATLPMIIVYMSFKNFILKGFALGLK